MKRAVVFTAVLAFAAAGCKKNEDAGFLVGQGVGSDARLTSDAYTWDCSDFGSYDWMGVLGFDITLEFVPDSLPPRDLPAPGSCAYGLSMFAKDALVSGTSIPDSSDSPGWRTIADEGYLDPVLDGLWIADVFDNVLSCSPVGDIIAGGVQLYDAGALDGTTSPVAGEVVDVNVTDGSWGSGIPFGEDLDVTWEASGWDETFVQVRRERIGVAIETITCNTTGVSEFQVTSETWDLFDDTIDVDHNFLYVGFQNVDTIENDYGHGIEVASRALHAVGLSD